MLDRLPFLTHSPLSLLRVALFTLTCAAVLLAAGLLSGVEVARAQDDGAEPAATAAAVEEPAAAADQAAAGTVTEPVTGTVSANAINNVARQLWCPLCSGVRLDACELKACAQMKDVIGQKLAAGEDAASIKNYFVAQYGPQVLGEPPLEGFNWLAWILPVVAVAVGGLFVWSRMRNSMRRAEVRAQNSAEIAPPAASSSSGEPATDAYGRKLEEELKSYD